MCVCVSVGWQYPSKANDDETETIVGGSTEKIKMGRSDRKQKIYETDEADDGTRTTTTRGERRDVQQQRFVLDGALSLSLLMQSIRHDPNADTMAAMAITTKSGGLTVGQNGIKGQ